MPTNEEIRAAAEMYRSGVEYDIDASEVLARAYLAEHPEDDGEPVTEEWLREQVGWHNHNYSRTLYPIDGTFSCLAFGERQMWVESLSGEEVHLLNNPTRGQVRRLIAALKGERP